MKLRGLEAIGDFTLFWTGVYPEALTRLQTADSRDHLLDYLEQGKRSYYIASTFENDPYKEEAKVLRRLSSEFELCAYGLSQVRKEWEKSASHDGQLLPHDGVRFGRAAGQYPVAGA